MCRFAQRNCFFLNFAAVFLKIFDFDYEFFWNTGNLVLTSSSLARISYNKIGLMTTVLESQSQV